MEEFLNKEGVVQTVQAIKDYVDQQDSAIQQNIEQNITGRIATLENQISNKVDKTQMATKQQPGLSRIWEENEIFHIWTMDPEQLNYTTEENEAGGETYDIRTLNYSVVPNEFGGETYYFGESGPGPGPTPPPVEEGVYFVDITTGITFQMAFNGSYYGSDNFSFEQGHEYQFRINLDGNLEQGWPSGGSDLHNDFPGDDWGVYLNYTGDSLQVLQNFVGRVRLRNGDPWTLDRTYSSIRYYSDN